MFVSGRPNCLIQLLLELPGGTVAFQHRNLFVDARGGIMFVAKIAFNKVPALGIVEGVWVGVGDDYATCGKTMLVEWMVSHELNFHWVKSCK